MLADVLGVVVVVDDSDVDVLGSPFGYLFLFGYIVTN